MVTRARSGLRGSAPVLVLLLVIAVAIAGVWLLVRPDQPTAGRPDDVAVYEPLTNEPMTDTLRVSIRREAGCTYLDAPDGRRWIAVFPDIGIRWEDGWIRVANERFPLATEIDIAGRIVKIPSAGYSTDIPSGCSGSDFFLVLSASP